MSLSNENLQCKVGKPHVPIEPGLLPCNYVACSKCIEKQKDYFNLFHCAFCKSNHQTSCFKINNSFEVNYKQNLIDLLACLAKKIEQIKEIFSNFQSPFENLFDFMEQDLLVKHESVCNHLDKVHYRLINQIDLHNLILRNEFKRVHMYLLELDNLKHTKDLNKIFQIELKLKEVKKEIRLIKHKILGFFVIKQEIVKNKAQLLGKIFSPLKIFQIQDVKETKAETVDLSDTVANITAICETPDQHILILDNYQALIVELSKSFKPIRKCYLNEIHGIRSARLTFNANLYSIACSSQYVYINHMERNEIIILNRQMTFLKTLFAPVLPKTSFMKTAIFKFELVERFIYVFHIDSDKIVLKYSELGDCLIEEIRLEKLDAEKYIEMMSNEKFDVSVLSICSSVAISSNKIACCNPILNELHIYNLKGKLLQTIQNENEIKSVCFMSQTFLVSYSPLNRSLFIYETENETISEFYQLKLGMKFKELMKETKSINFIHQKVVFFRNQLFILYEGKTFLKLIYC